MEPKKDPIELSAREIQQRFEEKVLGPIVRFMCHSKELTSLEMQANREEEVRESLLSSYNRYQERIQRGALLLLQSGRWTPPDDFTESFQLLKDEEAVLERLKRGETLRQMLSLSEELLVNGYEVATEYYQRSNFEEASDLFLLLLNCDYGIGAFWIGLALCEEALGRYDSSGMAYLLAAELSEEDLTPYLHACRCFLLGDKKEQAHQVIDRAIERSEEDPKWSDFRKQAEHVKSEMNA